ncbi:MAG: M48 family metalloprotease, partial [Candidatus Sumerlaeaceae bacterium]|nr:M48 family metalloprotease [Candidatus Sumerlaeaceae bacterium]
GLAVGTLLAPPQREGDFLWLIVGLVVGGLVFLVQYAIYAGAPHLVVFSGFNVQEVKKEDLPQLVNVVEEMTIAAGLRKVPRVYVIFDRAPNAFAFGRGDEASVAVTTGLLDMLNRDELQGVIAHEVGHIRNRDIDFMTLAAVMLGSIIVLGEIAYRLIYIGAIVGERSSSRSSSRRDSGGAEIIIIFAALIFMIIAPMLAQILYFASSRRREYLADASAALFTRYPEGLARALEKIAHSPVRMTEVNRAVAPLFIVNPLQRLDADSIFSTHPPIEKRIRILRSMAGASLYDYERAAEHVMGRSLIKRLSEEEKVAQPIATPRPTTPEILTMGGVLAAPALAAPDILRAKAGYRIVPCSVCQLKLKIPPTFPSDSMPCPRCGEVAKIPPAGAIVESGPAFAGESFAENVAATAQPVSTFDARTDEKPARKVAERPAKTFTLDVARLRGKWQTVACPLCSQKVQLSPAFQAKWIACPRCHSRLIFANNEEIHAAVTH